MRNYELVIVLDGKVTPAKKKAFIEKAEKLVKTFTGKIGKVEDLGTKDLAYKIKKSVAGAYLLFPLEMGPSAAKSFANKIRLEDEIIRHLLVSKD